MEFKKTYRILSIDGGGIKGLYSAKILEVFEKKYECKISDCFDMICGTSTGGIIAAGLAVGISAHDIVKFYKNDGPKIFSPQSNISRKCAFVKQLFVSSKYDNKVLRECLVNVFGDKKMKDSKVTLCIPSFNLSRGSTVVFKNDPVPELCRDNEHCLIDILLATSAAPTYFPVHSFESMLNDYFVDGGIWANNPSMIGIIEAIRFYIQPNGEYEQFEMLSIGSVDIPFGIEPRNNKMSAIKWLSGSKLLNSIFCAQAKNTEFTIKHLSSLLPGNCFRISSPALTPDQIGGVELDNATGKTLKLLESMGSDVAYKQSMNYDVEKFFRRG